MFCLISLAGPLALTLFSFLVEITLHDRYIYNLCSVKHRPANIQALQFRANHFDTFYCLKLKIPLQSHFHFKFSHALLKSSVSTTSDLLHIMMCHIDQTLGKISIHILQSINIATRFLCGGQSTFSHELLKSSVASELLAKLM